MRLATLMLLGVVCLNSLFTFADNAPAFIDDSWVIEYVWATKFVAIICGYLAYCLHQRWQQTDPILKHFADLEKKVTAAPNPSQIS